ncbi:MAG TPA: TraR/DksA family transcriptional regulator [Ktedonobacterales bacterium]
MERFDEADVRQRLTADRDRLQREIYDRIQGPEAVVPVDPLLDTGGVSSHEADDADAVSDYGRNQALVRNAQQVLAQVRAALERLDSGTYGKCERCGREIGARRLEALPYATLCIDCQEAVEHLTPAP